jgi:hypothetical protein
MKHAWKVAIAIGVIFVCIIGGVVASILYTNSTVHKLCDIVNIVANAPPPPGANSSNPSRQYQSNLHKQFTIIQRDYDC